MGVCVQSALRLHSPDNLCRVTDGARGGTSRVTSAPASTKAPAPHGPLQNRGVRADPDVVLDDHGRRTSPAAVDPDPG